MTVALPKTTTPRWQWNNYSFRAMNTNVYTVLFSQTDGMVLHDVERLFASFERRLSRFLSDSELSQMNRSAVFKASPTLFSAVQVALWAAETTGGLYDPTVLSHLEAAGYDRSFEQIEQPLPLSVGTAVAGQPTSSQTAISRAMSFQAVQLNPSRQTILKPLDLKLDLGGMGKGWTVDRAADRLQGLGPFVVNAGGDIFAYQAPPGEKGWLVDLVHPFKPNHFMAQVRLNHRALATSTIARRRWQRDGRVMHHLIDPRTGQPAQTDALSVSVVAERTVLAEVYAKVVLILGVERGMDYLQQLPGVEGLIYTADAEIVFSGGMTAYLNRLVPAGYPVERHDTLELQPAGRGVAEVV